MGAAVLAAPQAFTLSAWRRIDRKKHMEGVTPAKAGVQRRRRRLLDNQLFSVS